jgi:hypothetical protein
VRRHVFADRGHRGTVCGRPACRIAAWRPEITGREDFTRFEDGSLPVYAVGDDTVLKLYPPVHQVECALESVSCKRSKAG